MRITSWNINSVRARLHRLPAFLDSRRPDVLCLQELKCVADVFPREVFEERGYHLAISGQKTYNGVAVASLHPISSVTVGFPLADDLEARGICVQTAGLTIANVYVVNGRAVGHEKYHHKLRWLDGLVEWSRANLPATSPAILCGDFNVTPAPQDTCDPSRWEGRILCSAPERQRLQALLDLGLTDAWRHLHPDRTGPLSYTWWDYRGGGFERGNGLRIDHHLITASVRARLRACEIDRYERMGEKPSDHAPITLVLAAS